MLDLQHSLPDEAILLMQVCLWRDAFSVWSLDSQAGKRLKVLGVQSSNHEALVKSSSSNETVEETHSMTQVKALKPGQGST